MIDKVKDIVIAVLLVTGCVLFSVMSSGCKTQTVFIENENPACFNARYLAREGHPSESLSLECANSVRRDWCIEKAIKYPDQFRDFNDCWSKGK